MEKYTNPFAGVGNYSTQNIIRLPQNKQTKPLWKNPDWHITFSDNVAIYPVFPTEFNPISGGTEWLCM